MLTLTPVKAFVRTAHKSTVWNCFLSLLFLDYVDQQLGPNTNIKIMASLKLFFLNLLKNFKK